MILNNPQFASESDWNKLHINETVPILMKPFSFQWNSSDFNETIFISMKQFRFFFFNILL